MDWLTEQLHFMLTVLGVLTVLCSIAQNRKKRPPQLRPPNRDLL